MIAQPVGCDQGLHPAQPVGPPATQARVGLIEWDITTSSNVLAEGDVELAVTNAGRQSTTCGSPGSEPTSTSTSWSRARP
jgi:hypothetical protein